MPNKVEGDFSNYPEPLREIFPYIYGEACDLKTIWAVYHRLFISSERRTVSLNEYLGAWLAVSQAQLQDEMFIGIGRLTDRDRGKQKNLTLWTLTDQCEKWNIVVASELRDRVTILETTVSDIRIHRHKRVAHYDLSISLKKTSLPKVTLKQLRLAIDEIANIVNFIAKHAANSTIYFEALDHRDITSKTEATIAKAKAYDQLIKAGSINKHEWRQYLI